MHAKPKQGIPSSVNNWHNYDIIIIDNDNYDIIIIDTIIIDGLLVDEIFPLSRKLFRLFPSTWEYFPVPTTLGVGALGANARWAKLGVLKEARMVGSENVAITKLNLGRGMGGGGEKGAPGIVNSLLA